MKTSTKRPSLLPTSTKRSLRLRTAVRAGGWGGDNDSSDISGTWK